MFWIKFNLQDVLNWSLECKRQFFGIMFEIARKRLDKRLRPTLYLLLLTNINITFLQSARVFALMLKIFFLLACPIWLPVFFLFSIEPELGT
jgi:hypothetical protein